MDDENEGCEQFGIPLSAQNPLFQLAGRVACAQRDGHRSITAVGFGDAGFLFDGSNEMNGLKAEFGDFDFHIID